MRLEFKIGKGILVEFEGCEKMDSCERIGR